MRVVLDTNVFVSGIFWEGNLCSKIIGLWRKRKFELITSAEIIEELIRTLRTFKIYMNKELIEAWKNLIIENSIIVEPLKKINVIKEDPDDNKFIEAAFFGNADYIISQDKHLLNVKYYQNIQIVSPKEFFKILQ